MAFAMILPIRETLLNQYTIVVPRTKISHAGNCLKWLGSTILAFLRYSEPHPPADAQRERLSLALRQFSAPQNKPCCIHTLLQKYLLLV